MRQPSRRTPSPNRVTRTPRPRPSSTVIETQQADAASVIGAALRRGQDASGGWAHQAGGVPSTEATALALLALVSTGANVEDSSARAALSWLNARQHTD